MTKMRGNAPKPWVKLWREERDTFAQLPLLARALHSEMLKLSDDEGCIYIGDKDPADAIAYALGADRADRRALRKYLPVLINEGCLLHEPRRLRFRGWTKRQGTDPEAATKPPSNHEATTKQPRSNHEVTANPAESHDRKRQEGEGEGEKEEERGSGGLLTGERATERASPDDPAPSERVIGASPPPSGPTETELAAVASALARAWSDAWLAHTAGPAAPAQLAQVRTLAPWLVEYARRRPEAAIDLASPLVEAFFDARVKHARPRVEWLLEDPGNFLEKSLAAAVTEDRSYATYLAEYARNPVRAGDPH